MASDSPSILSAALFVSGASLGAGLLALPIQTGLSGLVPTLLALVCIWGLMYGSGLIIVETFVDNRESVTGLFSMYEHGLGRWSRWLVIPAFFLLFYGILVAYLCGSASVLSSLLNLPQYKLPLLLLFFGLSSTTVLVGMRFVHKANNGFMFILISSFLVMLFLVGAKMKVEHFTYQDWKFLPSALPIIVCAFAYQNVIPSVCSSLDYDRGQIHRAIFWGTLLSLVVNILWVTAVIGVLPLVDAPGSLLTAFHQNQPASVPIAQNIHSGWVGLSGLVFSMAALFTSYVAVGEGLRNFIADLFGAQNKSGNNWLVAVLTFMPPIIVTILYPQLFLKMMNLVGGVGVVLLFGLLPAGIFFRQARMRRQGVKQIFALLMGLIFAILLALECGQELGLLQIHPQVEYWGDAATKSLDGHKL